MNKKGKVLKCIVTVLLVVIAGTGIFWNVASENTKNSIIKEVSKWPVVRKVIGMSVEEDFDNNVKDKDFKKDNVTINKDVAKKLTGYTNIVLFGLDSRHSEFAEGTHSDSIIIASINNDTNEVKLSSIYRDTMMKIVYPDGSIHYRKANNGFFKGGVEGAMSMLNTNLDLNLSDYVIINFSGLANLIDELGGVDIKITEQEMKYINFYLVETRKITKMKADDLTEYGKVHLNGLQATSYCRIRYTAFHDEEGKVYNDDLGRTARQRFIIEKLVKKIKKKGVTGALSLASDILSSNVGDKAFIRTSLDYDEIMDLIPAVIDYNISDSAGFPYTLDTPTINGESMVVAEGLSYNVEELHNFLFNDDDYKVSSEVQSISDYIIDYTGIPEVHLKKETTEEETSESNEETSKSDESNSDKESDSNSKTEKETSKSGN